MNSEISFDPSTSFYPLLLQVRNELKQRGDRLVLAESCTSGLVAAELGQVPGISEHFCGSMVVYRTQSKSDWLGVPPDFLNDPAIGPVSEQTTVALVHAILEKTPESTVAAAITGHLGPGISSEMDGQIYCAFKRKISEKSTKTLAIKLTSPRVSDLEDLKGRLVRQREATTVLLRFIACMLST